MRHVGSIFNGVLEGPPAMDIRLAIKILQDMSLRLRQVSLTMKNGFISFAVSDYQV